MLARLKFDITNLVNEILNQIPNDVIINGKVLDPAMGGGQFVKEIERRKRLAGKTDQEISETVFGYEENILRRDYAVNKYDLKGKYIVDNFLERDFKDMKFDVIIGNPPYQKPGGGDRLGSRGSSSLWDKFVHKSLNLLNDQGYLSLIHPPAWRKPNERYSLWKELTSNNQMIYLKMRSGKGEQDIFDIGVRFDYYLVQKKEKYKNTKITDHENATYDLNLDDYNWLPNYNINEITKILGKGCKVLYNTAYHTQHDHRDTYSKDYPYPVVHTINKDGLGIKYFKERKDDIHFGIPKVLLNQNELQYPVNDYKGEYGMSQLTFGIAISSKDEGDKILNFLNSEKGKNLIAATKWNTFYTDYNMFNDFVKNWYEK